MENKVDIENYDALKNNIKELLISSKSGFSRIINYEIINSFLKIGKQIEQYEGSHPEEKRKDVISKLSEDLQEYF